jgi:hypothetical protein
MNPDSSCSASAAPSWSDLKVRDRVLLKSDAGTTIETEIVRFTPTGGIRTPDDNYLDRRKGWTILQHIPYVEPLPKEPTGYAAVVKFTNSIPFQRRGPNCWVDAVTDNPLTWEALIARWGREFTVLYEGVHASKS